MSGCTTGVRHGQYKCGYTFLGRDELYDLEADPAEMNNVIDDPAHADVARHIRGRLLGCMHQTHDWASAGFHALRFRGRTRA